MPTHVALLRGVNAGGNSKLVMADLRQLMTSLGHREVATYIQSGNVVFTPAAAGASASDLAASLAQAIAGTLGVAPRVVVLTRDELAEAVRRNPYPDEPDPKRVHVVFRGAQAGPETVAAVGAAAQQVRERGSRDRAALVGDVLYLHTPDGFGRSELAHLLLQRPASPVSNGTARNWATVTRLLDMCGGGLPRPPTFSGE